MFSDQQWDKVANDLRFAGTKLKLGAMLRSAKSRRLEGNVVVLGYSSVSNVERLKAELDVPTSLMALKNVFEKVLGFPYDLEVRYSDSASAKKGVVHKSHLVQTALSMGAKVSGIRE